MTLTVIELQRDVTIEPPVAPVSPGSRCGRNASASILSAGPPSVSPRSTRCCTCTVRCDCAGLRSAAALTSNALLRRSTGSNCSSTPIGRHRGQGADRGDLPSGRHPARPERSPRSSRAGRTSRNPRCATPRTPCTTWSNRNGSARTRARKPCSPRVCRAPTSTGARSAVWTTSTATASATWCASAPRVTRAERGSVSR